MQSRKVTIRLQNQLSVIGKEHHGQGDIEDKQGMIGQKGIKKWFAKIGIPHIMREPSRPNSNKKMVSCHNPVNDCGLEYLSEDALQSIKASTCTLSIQRNGRATSIPP